MKNARPATLLATLWMTAFSFIATGASEPRLFKLPLSFEANKGQAESTVKFLSQSRGSTLYLMPTEMVLALHGPGAKSESDVNTGGARGSTPERKAVRITLGRP